jgi:hypothetical protein
MAADLLIGGQSIDGGTGLAPESLTDEIRDGLGTACVIPPEDMANIGRCCT